MSSDQQQVHQQHQATTTASSPNNNNNSSTSPSTTVTATNNNSESPPEKATHYKYLKDFRVDQCHNFIQHKCTQHKPYTCFQWHFQNQRRRRPIKKRDGKFNYSPDVYCTKYDETTGLCEDGDDCVYLHRTSGDTERRYHLRYYKTGICVYETDARGYCVKNGQHCAFAHGIHDLRNPVYDVRELQVMEKSEGANGETNGPNPLDKERNALNEDPRWMDSAYVLCNYKTELCKRPVRLCRQGYACPQYHNSKDKRRSPKKFMYRSTPCPNVKQGDEWGDPSNCESGDNCSYCHTRTEQQFHPEIYKSTKCNDILQTQYCPRGPFCAFAHIEHEMQSRHDLLNEYDSKNHALNNAPPLTRAQSCSSGSRITPSSLPHDYPGMNAFQQLQQNQNAFSKAGGDSILGNPNSNHGVSLLGPGNQNQQQVQQQQGSSGVPSLGAIGTRPRSYSTSASMNHPTHGGMDQFFSRMNAAKMASRLESSQLDSHQQTHHSHSSSQESNTVLDSQRTITPNSGNRRSSQVYETASNLFPARFGSGDGLGAITTTTNVNSRNVVSNLESYSTAETVGSVVESAIGESRDHEHFDEIDALDFHHLNLNNRTNTSSLVNGNDVLLDHHHPNEQRPLLLQHHSVHGLSNSASSRTDPVNIPGVRLASSDRTLTFNNAASPPINSSPLTGSSFGHLTQFGLSPFPRSRVGTMDTTTMSAGVHNNSQASSVIDNFLSTSPQQSQANLIQGVSSIIDKQRLERENQVYQLKILELERLVQKQKDDLHLKDEELSRLKRENRELLDSRLRNSNHGLIGSSLYHPLTSSDVGSLSVEKLVSLREQLKSDLDQVNRVIDSRSSLSSLSFPTTTTRA